MHQDEGQWGAINVSSKMYDSIKARMTIEKLQDKEILK